MEQNAHIDTLKATCTGEVILPGEAGYDESSKVMVTTGSPSVVVRPADAKDVATAVVFAKDNGLALSVRSGGHGMAGHGTNNGGMVIDLRHLNAVEVIDKAQRIVRVGGGARWIDVGQALRQHGLAISSGDTKTVGVGGLTLGAGCGWMVRKYGLAIDSLIAAEVVLASGEIVRASNDDHADLFWAIRGGGGNFGVVTSFEFTAHEVGKVYAGMIMYDYKDLKHLLTGWRDAMRAAPEELTTMFLSMPPNPYFAGMPAGVIILLCYAGDDEAAVMQAIDPLTRLGTVLNKDIQRKDYVDVLEDAHPPANFKAITSNAFFRELSDDLIDAICKQSMILQIRSVGGAMNRVPADAMAFAHRDSEVLIVSPAFTALDATADDTAQALAPWRTLEPFASGAYVNFITEETPEHLRAAYPPATLERLQKIKATYDPSNLFNQNYNIKPS